NVNFVLLFFFFFQAVDGIRDGHVTGVQTCALPISSPVCSFIVTLHFYSWYWAYKTCNEMKEHTGDGIGGVIALIVQILLSAINEIGRASCRARVQIAVVAVGIDKKAESVAVSLYQI